MTLPNNFVGAICMNVCCYKNTKEFSTLQETHQELSSNLSITVKSACEYYKKVNNVYPEKIIIYRDGVSDGQLAMVSYYNFVINLFKGSNFMKFLG